MHLFFLYNKNRGGFMNMELYVCTYGDNGFEKGIAKINYNAELNVVDKKMLVEINGKANMVVVCDTCIYVSEQREDGNFLVTYDKEGNKIEQLACEYFYSWGHLKDNKLYLASFSSGVDSIYDVNSKFIITSYIHEDTSLKTGRSHYIHCLDKQVIAVENALQKVYFYKKDSLDIDYVLDFEEINVRLLSIHPSGKYAYMNTELTNEVFVLDIEDRKVVSSIKMSDSTGFSGGNALNKEGNILAVSVREEDQIYLFDVNNEKLMLKHVFACGAIPRDLKIIDNYLFVTCTKDNCVEIYDLNTYKKINAITLSQPITFDM